MGVTQRIITLRPRGAHGTWLTSHTLFGATCWALAALGEDVGTLLENFAEGPKFAFSAPFPFIHDRQHETPILLLPSPPLRLPGIDEIRLGAGQDRGTALRAAVDVAKQIQKATYVSIGVAAKLQSGVWGAADLPNLTRQGDLRLVKDVLLLKSEAQAIWGRELAQRPSLPWQQNIVTRNSIDRQAGATVPGLLFQQEQIVYTPDRAGLWFGVWATEDMWSILEGVFRYLEDTGLGGNRAVSKGHFSFDAKPWTAFFTSSERPVDSGTTRFLSLSTYIPSAPKESRPLAYNLETIRQKAENRFPQGEQRVYIATLRAFAPGSVFEGTTFRQRVYGRLVRLGEINHDSEGARTIWYSGLTLPLWGAWEV